MNLKTFTWDKLKKPGVPPGPRSGFAMTVHKRRFIIWGGVRDEEENDNLRSTFYNDMYSLPPSCRPLPRLLGSAPPLRDPLGCSTARSAARRQVAPAAATQHTNTGMRTRWTTGAGSA
jgi:hypothetical protein